jgi:ferric-dicitrate binding protein FerR (iron transport regulator)
VTTAQVSDLTELRDWTHGALVFHSASAQDVLTAVSRWYGVQFRVTDTAITHHRLTATFDTNGDRSDVLGALANVLGVRMTAVGDTITLTPDRAMVAPSPGRAPARRQQKQWTPIMEQGR